MKKSSRAEASKTARQRKQMPGPSKATKSGRKPKVSEPMQPAKRIRMEPEERKQQLLLKGLEMAVNDGLGSVNRVQLGKACGVTDGLVSKYFGNAQGMYTAIVVLAAKQKHIDVVADALQMGHRLDDVLAPTILKRAKSEVKRRLREEHEEMMAAYA